jgi:PKD repeat protein/glucose/arabinose dehydrogenase
MTGPEQVLVEDFCDQFGGHGGGGLEFGADGYLYATGGDGSSPVFWDYGQDADPSTDWHPINPCGDPPAGVDGVQSPPTAEGGRLRTQDLRTPGDPLGLAGSLIRIDPATGAGVPGNPMFANADPNARRMLAHGFRNAFRIAVRPGTNDVWVGDVGGAGWEEINRVPAPTDPVRNFGWPCYEGGIDEAGTPFAAKIAVADQLNLNICEDLFAQAGATTPPYFAYDHAEEVTPGDGCGTGGSVVSALGFYPASGGTFPDAYDGALLLGDLARRCIWAMLAGADGLPDPTRIQRLVDDASFPADFRVGPGGDLFYVNVYGGEVRRLHYTGNPDNDPPTAVAQTDVVNGDVPLTVHFDGTGSSDPDAGDALTYEWDLDGDGGLDDSTAVSPSFTYTTEGTVVVSLRVTDAVGVADTDTVTVYPGGGPPTVTIDSPSPSVEWAVGDTLSFSGSATDPDDGPLPASALDWALVLHHCPTNTCHEHPQRQWTGVSSGSFTAPNHDWPADLELRATARDSEGNVGAASVRLDSRKVNLNIQTSPQGMYVVWNDVALPSPYSQNAIARSVNTLSTPSPQTLGNTTYRFAGWLHGQAQTHTLVAPDSPRTYTARFAAVQPGTQVLAFRPEADAYVDESLPGANFGAAQLLRSGAAAGAGTEAHMRFLVSGVVGKIQSAKLRLRSITDTADGPAVFRTTAPWTENAITWANRPPAAGGALADAGAIAAGTVTDLDVTPAVTGEGAVSFKLAGTSSDPIDLHSREAAVASNSPALQVTVLNDAYPRPKGATPTLVALVPAFAQCTAANRVHGPPLAGGSCAPPVQTSAGLTVGTADANGASAQSAGKLSLSTLVGNPGTPADESDVRVRLSVADVRRQAGLADYAGELQAAATVRVTDRNSSPSGTDPATTTDLPLPVTVPCTITAEATIGSSCSVTTTLDALTPALVREGARSVWELGRLEVYDGGPDGDVDTPGNTVFLRQGLFIP